MTMQSQKIDSHHHFWQYTAAEYGWIDDTMSALRRDFLPDDLRKEMQRAGIDGAVSVQARQTIAETDWLLILAERHDFIKGVVGWVPLISPGVEGVIERFAQHKKMKAVRHVLQDEPDDRYILREDFNAGIFALAKHGLAYDILVFERHLPQTFQFVDRHPNQTSWTSPGPPPHFRECGARKRRPLSDATSVVSAFTPFGVIRKILHLIMEPVAISHIINLEGYTERTRGP